MSNILSASSKTKNFTDEKVTVPLLTKSIRRPGVATKTWTPFYVKINILLNALKEFSKLV